MANCIIDNNFQHISRYTDYLLLNTLEVNLKYFLDNAFLKIGAWTDISIDQPQIFESSLSDLVVVNDPSYVNGQVWQGNRKGWVWENDISFEGNSPIQINGVIVNNNLTTNSYNIDYINGRVIFDSPINTDSKVKISHSYRNVQTYRASDAPWWQLLQSNSFEPNELVFNNNNWSIGSHHRVQMPCIIIDSVSRSQNMPFELGNKSLIIKQDVLFNVLAETKNERNQLLDILRVQQDNTIWLYDINKAAKNNHLPLDYNGFKNLTGLSYTDLVNTYKWGKVFFEQISLSEVESININLYEGIVRVTFEIIFDGFNT